MRFLLDTNVIIRSVKGSLSNRCVDIIEDTGNSLYYSPISIWEIAIKQSNGKLSLPVSAVAVQNQLEGKGCRELPLTSRHALAVSVLSLIHKDPFDRMLIAQSFVEDLTLITTDSLLGTYSTGVMVVD